MSDEERPGREPEQDPAGPPHAPEPGSPGARQSEAGPAEVPAPAEQQPASPGASVDSSVAPPGPEDAEVEATPSQPTERTSNAPPAPSPPPLARRPGPLEERPEEILEVPAARLKAQSRRDFFLFSAGLLATAVGAWWLLPSRSRARLLPQAHDRLDTLAARVGLTRERRERTLNRALTFDDDVAEALYSRGRRVREYDRSQVTAVPNNYNGETPDPDYIPGWRLNVSGLASGRTENFSIQDLMGRFKVHDQVTRLVCVEGWSAVGWWGGIRFADFLEAYPPAPGMKWASLRSSVNLDGNGDEDPYYVSIDLETARHPQALLATHHDGRPLTVEHGAPMRLLVPMKLGLKNIKAITDIAYTAEEPADYWNERGYSKYDGL